MPSTIFCGSFLVIMIVRTTVSGADTRAVMDGRRNYGTRWAGFTSRDFVGADFQSVRKLTNYICAALPESCQRHFSNTLGCVRL